MLVCCDDTHLRDQQLVYTDKITAIFLHFCLRILGEILYELVEGRMTTRTRGGPPPGEARAAPRPLDRPHFAVQNDNETRERCFHVIFFCTQKFAVGELSFQQLGGSLKK